MIEQKIINKTWALAQSFQIKKLTRVIALPVLYTGGIKSTAHGFCTSDGEISIRYMSVHPKPRRLRDTTIIDTIAHEVAHLDEFNEGKGHRGLTYAMACWLLRNWDV